MDDVKDSFVESISFDLDINPTFDKKAIPFEFIYCYSIRIKTEKESYNIITSMTDCATETFWIFKSAEVKNFSKHLEVNSKIKSIESKYGTDNYAFKIRIEFENRNLFIYCGEVYDTTDNTFDFRINDEMILVFEHEKYTETFESLVSEKMDGSR